MVQIHSPLFSIQDRNFLHTSCTSELRSEFPTGSDGEIPRSLIVLAVVSPIANSGLRVALEPAISLNNLASWEDVMITQTTSFLER